VQIHRTSRVANIFIISALAVAALYFAAAFLIPLVFAALLAMLFYRFSEWLEKKQVKRGVSALLSVLVLIGVIAFVGMVLVWQLSYLAEDFDDMKTQLTSNVNKLREWISDSVGIDISQEKRRVAEDQERAMSAGNIFLKLLNRFAGFLVDAVLVVVYTYLFLYYRSHLKNFLLQTIPAENRHHVQAIIRKAVNVSGTYLIGLFNMVAILWVMYSIGFNIVGLEGAIFFAILCGIFEIVPFIGNLFGNLIAILAVMAQGGDGGMVLGIIAVYLTVQFIQTYLLEPLVVGQRVNINPLFTIMALVAGQLIWGIPGVIMAIPVLGIVKIIWDHIPDLQAYGMVIGAVKPDNNNPSILDFLKRLVKRK